MIEINTPVGTIVEISDESQWEHGFESVGVITSWQIHQHYSGIFRGYATVLIQSYDHERTRQVFIGPEDLRLATNPRVGNAKVAYRNSDVVLYVGDIVRPKRIRTRESLDGLGYPSEGKVTGYDGKHVTVQYEKPSGEISKSLLVYRYHPLDLSIVSSEEPAPAITPVAKKEIATLPEPVYKFAVDDVIKARGGILAYDSVENRIGVIAILPNKVSGRYVVTWADGNGQAFLREHEMELHIVPSPLNPRARNFLLD